MKKVLIVEDEAALRKVYVMLFNMQKFKVYEAPHGKLALEQLDTVKPDIIILDVLMPVMGGIEFLEKVDVKKKYPKMKILVLSNLSDPKTLDQIEKLGATKYLLKAGTSPTELIDAVKQLLET
ncbi:response regulator transcription factor [Candidatus Saccharibacteria bacterium]|nr:response regulator transcription factor [Candidatus Saccharibacteria bacterium]